ncbi:MAG: ATP-binding protein [Actinomycetota bacterium]
MQVCPGCGEENPDRFRLCGLCGTPLTSASPSQEVRKTVTIVFSDLKGYTSLGETLDSESLREVLNRYFGAMKAMIERHGGTVEKYIGDAVMAVFGLPRVREDDALRAVRAAADMREALAELNLELQEVWGVTLANRTGVNTGEVVAGDATTGQRLVSGDAVNVAARLEQAAPDMQVLIGEPTYRLVRDAVEVEVVEPLSLKGKAEPVPAYRLIAARGGETVPRRADTPMVGRARELRELREAFARAMDGPTCQLVTLLGPAGIGKSRLVHEFLRSVESEALAMRGRCLSYGEGITYWPLAEAVKEAAAITEEDDPAGARSKLMSLLAGTEAAVVDRIASAIGLSTESFSVEDTFWAGRKLLEALGRRRPVVFVVDDIHWAEETFLELMEHLIDSASGSPILLLCTSRPDLVDERPSWASERSNVARLYLEPLSEDESGLIVTNLIGSAAGLPDLLHARINEAAQGYPLYVEQMLSMLIDDGLLVRDEADGWVLAGDIGSVSVPPSISALLAARLDLLTLEERSVLERASVVGQVFYAGALRALSGNGGAENIAASLSGLTGKQLIRSTDSTFEGEEAFSFVHILIRDAAYQGLLKRRRAELHERFADWLEEALGIRVMEQEEIVGYHLEQSHRYRAELGPLDDHGRRVGDRAAARLASAGVRGFGRGDMPAAVNLLDRATALFSDRDPRRLRLLPTLGEALAATGEFSRADEALDRALAGAAELGDRKLETDANLVRLGVRFNTDPKGWSDEVLREAERAISIYEEIGDNAGQAMAWHLLGSVHGTACRYGAAEQASRMAVHHARLAGDRRQEARNLFSCAMCALYGPTPVAEAIEQCEEVRTSGDRRAEALAMVGLGHLHAMEGRFEQARGLCRSGRAALEDLGGKVLAASTSIDSGPVELLADDPVAAEAELRQDYQVLAAMGEKYLLSTTAALLSQALYAQGREDEAEQLTFVSEETAAPDDVESQVIWRCVRGKVLAGRGRVEEGEALLRQAEKLIMDTEDIDVQGHVLTDLARVLLRADRREEAVSAIRAARSLFERKGNIVAAGKADASLRELGYDAAGA